MQPAKTHGLISSARTVSTAFYLLVSPSRELTLYNYAELSCDRLTERLREEEELAATAAQNERKATNALNKMVHRNIH